jgi:hypothetical protein
VSAAIDEHIDLVGSVAHDDDFFHAKPSSLESPRFSYLRLETDVEPALTLENALLLPREDLGVGVYPIRDA